MRIINRFVSALAVLAMCASPAMATDIDLSGMSLSELVELKDRINLAMWETDEWQEVKVPTGVYQVGVDIPSGMWTVYAAEGEMAQINIGTELNEKGTAISKTADHSRAVHITHHEYGFYNENKDKEYDSIELFDGDYVIVGYSAVTFTPYIGRSDLGFKW